MKPLPELIPKVVHGNCASLCEAHAASPWGDGSRSQVADASFMDPIKFANLIVESNVVSFWGNCMACCPGVGYPATEQQWRQHACRNGNCRHLWEHRLSADRSTDDCSSLTEYRFEKRGVVHTLTAEDAEDSEPFALALCLQRHRRFRYRPASHPRRKEREMPTLTTLCID